MNDEDRHDLGDGDDRVDEGGLLDAAQDHEVEQPDADRGDDDGDDGVAVAEDREERAERRLDQHPVGDVADATADPVAEGRQEARIVAEAGLGIGEDAGVEIGLALGKRLEHAGQHVHAGAGDAPGDDRAERAGRVAEGSRQGEDARADHRSDDHGGQCEQRELLQRFRRHALSRQFRWRKSSLDGHRPERSWIGCNSNGAAATSRHCSGAAFSAHCTFRVRHDIG